MSRLTYHIPDFTFADRDPAAILDHVVAQARSAEAGGFDRVTVMDHLYQLPGIGRHDEPMLECYTLLAALAQHTSTVRLGALVTGNTYRNPGLLAKAVSTLDIVSGGRATLGIGAGWFQLEHEAFGFDFQTFTQRFEWLEDSLRIVVPLLRGETVTVEGTRHVARDAVLSPRPISRVPVMIGGSGERKTLRMVAQYADESNLVGIREPSELRRKFAALDAHCERLGRDRDEITVSMLASVTVAPTEAEADEDLRSYMAMKGMPTDDFERARTMRIHGGADEVAARLRAFVAEGLDGLAVWSPTSGHVPGRVELLGEVAASALDG